ncbi:MAG: helix-turn-helix domain-containing protein [Acidobacteriota bacterium]
MMSIGERLRQERLRRGVSLSQVSEQIKIRAGLLAAIEADDFDQLPGEFFARAFVRQYGRLLGVEESEIETMLAQRFGAPPAVEEAPPARLAGEAGQPPLPWAGDLLRNVVIGAAGFAVVALAGVAVYFWWQSARRPVEIRPAPVAVPAPAPTTPAASPAQTLPPEAAPAEPTPQPPPATEAALVVDVTATRSAWIRVTSDGVVVYEATLQPGAGRTFQASQSVRVYTGNAGGLEIRLNGKPIGPVGPEGQVRAVELTAAGPVITVPKPRTAKPGTP